MQEDIKIESSLGFDKAGRGYAYIRPKAECFNKSRRVTKDRVVKTIKKWYSPKIILYEIDGKIIGSNCEDNALKEWWRVCEKDCIGFPFPVTLAAPLPHR